MTNETAEGIRTQGKVFLTIEGGSAAGDYVCSGTALNSHNESVVWSAGHCTYDTDGGGYATNWLFVPAYENGTAPFGEWPAVALGVPTDWRSNGNSSYDIGAAKVAKNRSGQTLNDVVGGRGITFNGDREGGYTSFGYPAAPPPLAFTGGQEFRCDSSYGGGDDPGGSGPNTMWIGCDMTQGSSGGGWIRGGSLRSVNSYNYCDITGTLCQKRLYGPYLNDVAQQLYKGLAEEPYKCQGETVTILGTGAADKLKGTNAPDVIKGFGGKDTIQGLAGKDTVCGDGGADKIKGGNDKDELYGDGGDDAFDGGNGKDFCNGGKGKDKAKSCKKVKKIP